MKNRKLVLLVTLIMVINSVFITGCRSNKAKVKTSNENKKVVKAESKATENTLLTNDSIKKVTKEDLEKAMNLYKDYLSKYSADEPITELALVDINSDGIPELFGGSVAKEYSPIKVALTVNNGVLTELKFEGDYGISGDPRSNNDNNLNIGIITVENIKKYKDSNNKEIFVGQDGISRNIDACTSVEYVINLNNGVINTKEIFYKDIDNEEHKNLEKYKYIHNDVGKDQYKSEYKEYYSKLKVENIEVYNEMITTQDYNNFLEEGFKVFSGEKLNKKTYNSSNLQSSNNNSEEKESNNISKEEAITLAEKANGSHMKYGCDGKAEAGFKVDGIPSEEYYKVYGIQDGVIMHEGYILVHAKTGKVYLLSGDGTICTIPGNDYVGNYSDK